MASPPKSLSAGTLVFPIKLDRHKRSASSSSLEASNTPPETQETEKTQAMSTRIHSPHLPPPSSLSLSSPIDRPKAGRPLPALPIREAPPRPLRADLPPPCAPDIKMTRGKGRPTFTPNISIPIRRGSLCISQRSDSISDLQQDLQSHCYPDEQQESAKLSPTRSPSYQHFLDGSPKRKEQVIVSGTVSPRKTPRPLAPLLSPRLGVISHRASSSSQALLTSTPLPISSFIEFEKLLGTSLVKLKDIQSAYDEIVAFLSHSPERKEAVVILLKTHEGKNRVQKLILSLASNLISIPCISSYAQPLDGGDKKQLADKIVKYYTELKLDDFTIARLCAALTKEDLKKEMVETWDREASISSCVCISYLKKIMKLQFDEFDSEFKAHLSKYDPHPLILDQYFIAREQSLGPQEAAAIAQSNVERFIPFAEAVLNKIYSMPLNDSFKTVVTLRRLEIDKFLKKNNALETSIAVNSAILFLRILSPLLATTGQTEAEKSVMKSLSKVVQQISNQLSFGTEKTDAVYQLLNPLVDVYKAKHLQFFDKLTYKIANA